MNVYATVMNVIKTEFFASNGYEGKCSAFVLTSTAICYQIAHLLVANAPNTPNAKNFSEVKIMLVVNLFGVPGAGKSTGAAYIFSQLKTKGVNAELVTEFAKEMVWENNNEVFKNQAYIFGTQSFRISRCNDKVDVIVTDCPLFLTAFYNKSPVLGEDFNRVVFNVFNSYNNMNYFIDRVKDYNPIGRRHTEQESKSLKQPMLDMMNRYKVDGDAHTLTVTDLSDQGVKTSIRYGNTADSCTMTSAPNFTKEGYNTVYYKITYSYNGESMTENGVSYVWLLEEPKNDEKTVIIMGHIR